MSLGNFGVYKRIFEGVGDYKGFYVEIDGAFYEVGDVKITDPQGVVLTLGEKHYLDDDNTMTPYDPKVTKQMNKDNGFM